MAINTTTCHINFKHLFNSTVFVTPLTDMLRAVLIFCLAAVSVTAASDTIQKLSEANEKFTKALFQQIRVEKGNLFFSPLSLEILLALTHASTGGNTARQIQQAYNLPETREKSAKLYGDLAETLASDGNITFNLANALFLDKKFPIKRDYLDFVKNGFKADVGRVEFSKGEEARGIINEYIADNTGNKIKDMLPPDSLNAGTAFVLLNALYFKADWLHKFSPLITHPQHFHLNSNNAVEADFMRIAKSFPFTENKELDAKIVKIPYKGESVSMVLIVPNTIDGIDQVESKIASTDLNELTKNLYSQNVIINMPKFKLEGALNLKEILPKMGITEIFSPGVANFTRMTDASLFVSNAFQRAVIEVNEEGTEAAAVTIIAPIPTSLPPPPVVINVDRPFLFFLSHNPTGLRLFMGRVASPYDRNHFNK